jgi:hypothetical protein
VSGQQWLDAAGVELALGGQTISPIWMRAGFIERVEEREGGYREVIISGGVALFSCLSGPTRRLAPRGVNPEHSNGRLFGETWSQSRQKFTDYF